ncbi:MAG: D-aminoacylase [Candidatus Heimdallarchaeota archaeon]|nr:D-aminoacylase [Candidatus Heimdallarchaeota archaeon]
MISQLISYKCKVNEKSVELDYIIKNGLLYDGSGNKPFKADIGIKNNRIVKIGTLDQATKIIDVSGLLVAPGFINMLSWSVESLIDDGRALGTLKQGVTLEVMGESVSWGPMNEYLKQVIPKMFTSDFEYEVTWNTLGEYLQMLEDKGISTNIASFVGAATVRMYCLKEEDVKPTPEQLQQMMDLVEEAMKEGAMGISTALIYPPASYAETDEIIALAKVAAKHGGMYISHMRSEGQNLLQALEEFITIARDADIHAEIYHLKAAGKSNWHKMDEVIKRINEARNEGLRITTDCYLYTAAGTGLDSCIPPWVAAGGRDAFVNRLQDSVTRDKIKEEMLISSAEWENLYIEAGPENIIPIGFNRRELRKYAGKTIAELSEELGMEPRDTVIHLLIEDHSRVATMYRIMKEENIEKKLALHYMSFGSDGESMSAEGKVLDMPVHPRSYGNVTMLLSKYVRDKGIIPMEEAIRKLTSLPAENLKIKNRGRLKEGYFADIVVFDLKELKTDASYTDPHHLSEGMQYVFVNGELVLNQGEFTGATPGKFIKGPGYVSSE